jgi:hypothetical protein
MLCIRTFSEVLGMFLNLVQTYVPVISALGILRPKLVVTFILEVFGLMLCDCVIPVLGFMMTKLIDIYVGPGSSGNVMFDLGDVLLCGHYHFDLFRSYSAMCPLMLIMMAKLVDTYILKADTYNIRISYFEHTLLCISWAFDQLWFYSATRHLIDWTWAHLGSWVPACKNCMLIIWFPWSHPTICFNGSHNQQQ